MATMFMQHMCEGCRRLTVLHYCRQSDEYLCEECIECAVEEIELLFDSADAE
jgi:hypothetical protein